MFFKSIIRLLDNAKDSINEDNYNHVDPNLVRYFRTEYGKDWISALEYHLYKEDIKNKKKAA